MVFGVADPSGLPAQAAGFAGLQHLGPTLGILFGQKNSTLERRFSSTKRNNNVPPSSFPRKAEEARAARYDAPMTLRSSMPHPELTEKPTNGDSSTVLRPRPPPKAPQLNKLYALPTPLRTFPLPNFIPHNPLSLFHILYAWASQTIRPPSSHPQTPYQGWISEETQSVHVTDSKAIRALWEQGFYGKGSLSRSEPSWLDREKRRRGVSADQTSEEVTRKRRDERQQAKWERARKEREAIDKRLLEERGPVPASATVTLNGESQTGEVTWLAPVGPLEILALPNSSSELIHDKSGSCTDELPVAMERNFIGDRHASYVEVELPNKDDNVLFQQRSENILSESFSHSNGYTSTNGHVQHDGLANGVPHANGLAETPKQTKGQKVVRFSPKVEKTTYLQSEPPSPELAATGLAKVEDSPAIIEDREHLQLTMEEAFFLTYGLGVLRVFDPKTKTPISTRDLLSVFRRNSYYPPHETPSVSPDDPFMISYAVYHHFRSLGWVVRGGTKFSVDYLLYNRGPVFTHAEFAVLIIPSYSDPLWSADESKRDYVTKMEKRRWSWLHCINRVNSQVKKTLVLVYVDVPPAEAQSEEFAGMDNILKRYRIREFVMKRWASNRSRG